MDVVEECIQDLKDKKLLTRMNAATALAHVGDERAVEPLIQVLKDEDEYNFIRGLAAIALGGIGEARAVEPLTEASKDKDKTVREAAQKALKMLKARKS